MKNQTIALFVATTLVVALGSDPAGAESGSPGIQPPLDMRSDNEKCVAEAWAALNSNKLESAQQNSSRCIDKFEDQARRMQNRLAEQGPPEEPSEISKAEQDEVFRRGVLNDVGTAHWIFAQSVLRLGNRDEAITALSDCASFTHALTWDIRGWFWSPAGSCADQLARLKR